jgi:hypothetical protein
LHKLARQFSKSKMEAAAQEYVNAATDERLKTIGVLWSKK